MKHKLLSLLFFFIFTSTFSQIIGNVTDANGNPLSTVNIYIEDTFIGTHLESFFVKPWPGHPHYYHLVLSPPATGTD